MASYLAARAMLLVTNAKPASLLAYVSCVQT